MSTPEIEVTTCKRCVFCHLNPVKLNVLPRRYLCILHAVSPSDVSEHVPASTRPENCPLVGKSILIKG